MQSVDLVTIELRKALATGDWSVGDKFMTFDELQAKYPVLTNIYRVRNALAPLIEEGLLESQQGSGTWVRALPSAGSATDDDSRSQLVAEILTDLTALRAKVEVLKTLV
jgi:DNA-binding GntR family transcriptional regulator